LYKETGAGGLAKDYKIEISGKCLLLGKTIVRKVSMNLA